MRKHHKWILLTMLILATAGLPASSAHAQWPPTPRPVRHDDGAPFSAADFQRALAQLKTERDALDADWKSLAKRLNSRAPCNEADLDRLHEQLKQTLLKLQQERFKSPKAAVPGTPPSYPPGPEAKKRPGDDPAPAAPGVPAGNQSLDPLPLDALPLAQTLYRAERYEEALTAFQSVDLKNKRAEERAPIIFLTAKCLYYLGKSDEAVTLMREVANSKGDERLAGYAQWEIENHRWHREIQARLEEIRQRRLAAEKR